jgi:hypothetical protein
LVTGLLLGVLLGILYAWTLSPIEYVDTEPKSLRGDFKDEYRLLIASAYQATGNLERARARLALFGESDPAETLGAQAQRMLANNAPQASINLLANLSQALRDTPAGQTIPPEQTAEQAGVPSLQTSLPSQTAMTTPLPNQPTSTPVPSPTPIDTATPRPSRTPTATQGAPFVLVSQSTDCIPEKPGRLEIYVFDATGSPAPGIEMLLGWLGGEEIIFSGLKPDISAGYADFQMTLGIEYVLSLSEGSTRISGLSAPQCPTDNGESYPGSIRLEFRQP